LAGSHKVVLGYGGRRDEISEEGRKKFGRSRVPPGVSTNHNSSGKLKKERRRTKECRKKVVINSVEKDSRNPGKVKFGWAVSQQKEKKEVCVQGPVIRLKT